MSTVKQDKKSAYGCMDMLWAEYREMCYGAPATVKNVPLGTEISAELGDWAMTAEGNTFKNAMDYMRSQLDRLHWW